MAYSRKDRSRPKNGEAQSNTYLLVFNLDDESQAKAWSVAQQLAGQRKLKQVLMGLLLAIHTVEEQTGKTVDMLEFMSKFLAGLIRGVNHTGYAPVEITESTQPEELPSMFAGTADHADPTQAREAFSAGMGDLFGDDDDDLWD